MKNKISRKMLVGVSLVFTFVMPNLVFAQCPVCTVAIGVGVGLCRYLGIDDLITGLWIGALLLALAVGTEAWFAHRFKGYKEVLNSWFRKFGWTVAYWGLTIVPLQMMGVIGNDNNKFLWVDKLVISSVAGIFVLILGICIDGMIRKCRKGKVLFYYQKVIIPILLLLVASFLFNLTICK